MKKVLCSAILILAAYVATAQWTINGAGDVYNTNSSGKAGIGITNPTEQLHLNGSIRMSGSSRKIIVGSEGSVTDYLLLQDVVSGNPSFQWVQNGVAMFSIDGVTGNVGIGTSSPAGNLEISTNTTGGEQLRISNGNTAGRATVTLNEGSTTKAFFQYRGTTNPAFANSLRLMTQSGTNADIYLGANGGHHLFIAGGQNGLANGNIGIGTATPDAKLTVKGTIHAEEVKVDLTIDAPDYVFEKDYPLPSLAEVKKYINENKHLPEVPSAAAMEANGINLGEMNLILLKKIEELTLHLIRQQEEIEVLKEQLSQGK